MHSVNSEAMSGPGTGSSANLQILLAYEDLATGSRAVGALHELFQKLPFYATFDLKLRKLELLQFPELRQEAAAVAARADIVVLSAHGPEAITPALNEWVQLWMERKGDRVCALGILFDPEQTSTHAGRDTLERLESITRQGAVDVLHGFPGLTGSEPGPVVRHLAERNARNVSVTPAERLHSEGRWRRRCQYRNADQP